MQINTIGLDIAKNVFQVHGVDGEGRAVLCRKVRRHRLVKLFEEAQGKKDLDPVLAHELATKVARNYEDRLNDSAKAIEFFKKALAIEPDDLNALGVSVNDKPGGGSTWELRR